MSFMGRLGRGLLQGAAGYFGELAERQEYDRRAAVAMQREEALERLRQDGRNDEIEALRGLGNEAPSSPPRPGDISADGRFRWNGSAWIRRTAADRPDQERLIRNDK